MGINLDEFADKYFYVTREEIEMEYIGQRFDDDRFFEDKIRAKHERREHVNEYGRKSLEIQPLAQIISITVEPKNEEQQLAVYGNIYADFGDAYYHHIYSRKLEEDPDIIGTEGSLTLNGPDDLSNGTKDYPCLPLFGSKICLKLFDQTNGLFADEYFTLDDEDDHIDDNDDHIDDNDDHIDDEDEDDHIDDEDEDDHIDDDHIDDEDEDEDDHIDDEDDHIDDEDEDDHIDDKDYYMQVKSLVVDCQQMYLTLQYLAIPFGLYCRLVVAISYKKGVEQPEILKLNGKIVARIGGTYGDCSSQELLLFKKEDTEFELVEKGGLKLSRSWVSLPVYAPLVIEVMDLSEFGGRKIGNGIIKLLPQQDISTSGSLLLDDMIITVSALWWFPQPMGPNVDMCSTSLPQIPTKMAEEMETEASTEVNKKRKKVDSDGKDKSAADDDGESPSDESKGGFLEQVGDMDVDREDKSFAPVDDKSPCVESGDVLASSRYPSSWHLVPHKNKPQSSPAVEIFSVFIGKEKSKAGQIYGSIEVKCDLKNLCYIFKRDENDVSRLSEDFEDFEDFEVIPVSDGSRSFDFCEGLKIKFDLKGVNGLTIKGYVDWAASAFNGSTSWYGKQLSSFVQGHGGFATVHYSVFSKAVSVILKVSLQFETRSFDEVCGSVVSQYSSYDYSSPYNKDFYRTVLFNMTQGDHVQIENNAQIPLSRSMLVVPSSSSLILDVNLKVGSYQDLSHDTIIIQIGEDLKIINRNGYRLCIELDWCKIK